MHFCYYATGLYIPKTINDALEAMVEELLYVKITHVSELIRMDMDDVLICVNLDGGNVPKELAGESIFLNLLHCCLNKAYTYLRNFLLV